jgi:hypothetical protein
MGMHFFLILWLYFSIIVFAVVNVLIDYTVHVFVKSKSYVYDDLISLNLMCIADCCYYFTN